MADSIKAYSRNCNGNTMFAFTSCVPGSDGLMCSELVEKENKTLESTRARADITLEMAKKCGLM